MAKTRHTHQVTLKSLQDLLESNFERCNIDLSDIKKDVLEIRNVIMNLIEENKNLQKRVSFLENQITHIDTDIVNNQYIRRKNIEVTGIPHSIENNKLEVVEILKAADIRVEKHDIEACHRLPLTNIN